MKAARTVYVISDLHLGGEYPHFDDRKQRGFRLCTRASEITRFVEGITRQLRVEAVELIINGDFVDFLAEENALGTREWSAFTSTSREAVSKFERIAKRDRGVFDALNRFLESGGRLVILLGNHDIELSLPAVRSSLNRAIGADGQDFQFIYDGEAYVVGDALIEHGNRYDQWNQVDYDSLRRVRSLQSRDQEVPSEYEFQPPPGSILVASVINKIKREYPFIDLLKPETSAVVPLLLALEPKYRRHLGKLAALAYANRHHGLTGAAFPSYGGDISAVSSEEAALNKAVRDTVGAETEDFLAALEPSEQEFGGEISTADTVSRVLGFARLLTAQSSKGIEGRLSALRCAMRGVQNEGNFDRTKELAAEYLTAAQMLTGTRFRYVCFGHTHLPKKVDLGNGRWYLNSGTWADMLEFPREVLIGQDANALSSFVDKMASGDFSPWTLFRPSYVRFEVDGRDQLTAADLCSFQSDQES
jgi:UDP-2,3-diacylglucosamine pyrophosphatase LpxH